MDMRIRLVATSKSLLGNPVSKPLIMCSSRNWPLDFCISSGREGVYEDYQFAGLSEYVKNYNKIRNAGNNGHFLKYNFTCVNRSHLSGKACDSVDTESCTKRRGGSRTETVYRSPPRPLRERLLLRCDRGFSRRIHADIQIRAMMITRTSGRIHEDPSDVVPVAFCVVFIACAGVAVVTTVVFTGVTVVVIGVVCESVTVR